MAYSTFDKPKHAFDRGHLRLIITHVFFTLLFFYQPCFFLIHAATRCCVTHVVNMYFGNKTERWLLQKMRRYKKPHLKYLFCMCCYHSYGAEIPCSSLIKSSNQAMRHGHGIIR